MQTSQIAQSVTRPANTTAYTAGDAVGSILQFGPTGASLTQGGQLKAAACSSSNNGSPLPDLELWLFSAALATPPVDNAAFAPTDADIANLIGIVKFPVASWAVGNAGSAGAGNSGCVATGFDIPVPATIFGQLVVRNAYVPLSAEAITVNLSCLRSYEEI